MPLRRHSRTLSRSPRRFSTYTWSVHPGPISRLVFYPFRAGSRLSTYFFLKLSAHHCDVFQAVVSILDLHVSALSVVRPAAFVARSIVGAPTYECLPGKIG